MVGKSRWKGTVLYGAYLVAMGMIWTGVESTGLSATVGLTLALLLGAAMAVVWPRW